MEQVDDNKLGRGVSVGLLGEEGGGVAHRRMRRS